MWLINLAGVALIAAIAWWFWMARPAGTHAAGEVLDILVRDGVYQPARIETVAGRPLRLRFLRKDPSPCAAMVVFPDFDVSAELPLDQPREIVLNPTRAGSYRFTCQMQMYRGELIVSDA